MNLREIALLLRAKWKLMLMCAAVTALLVFVFGLLSVKYQARGALLLRPLGADSLKLGTQPRIGTVFSEHLSLIQQQGVSYLQLLRSRVVMRETVLRVGLDKHYSSGRLWIAEMLKAPVRLVLYGRLPAIEQTPVDRAVEKLMRQTSVQLVLTSSVISVTVKGSNAKQAAETANTLMHVFREYTQKNAIGASGDLERFMQDQLLLTRAELAETREKSRRVLEELNLQGVEGLSAEITRLNLRIQGLAVRQEEIRWQRENLLNRLAVTNEQIARWQEARGLTYALSQNTLLQTLQQRLYEQRIELQRQSADFAEGSVAAKSLRDQIAVTEKTIAEQVQRLSGPNAGTFQTDPVWADLYQQKAKGELEMALLPFEGKQNAEMIVYFQEQVRRLEEMRPKFESIVAAMKPLIQREEEILSALSAARAYAARGIGEVDIFELAEAPRYPLLNNVPLAVYVFLGGLAGGFLPIGLILLRRGYEQRRQSVRELAEALN